MSLCIKSHNGLHPLVYDSLCAAILLNRGKGVMNHTVFATYLAFDRMFTPGQLKNTCCFDVTVPELPIFRDFRW